MKETDICEYTFCAERDILIDVRDKALFKLGTLPGAINIPMDNIKELYLLPRGKDIYVFCQVGDFSGEVVELLADAGYSACNLTGGYRKYMRTLLQDIKSQGEDNGKR